MCFHIPIPTPVFIFNLSDDPFIVTNVGGHIADALCVMCLPHIFSHYQFNTYLRIDLEPLQLFIPYTCPGAKCTCLLFWHIIHTFHGTLVTFEKYQAHLLYHLFPVQFSSSPFALRLSLIINALLLLLRLLPLNFCIVIRLLLLVFTISPPHLSTTPNSEYRLFLLPIRLVNLALSNTITWA